MKSVLEAFYFARKPCLYPVVLAYIHYVGVSEPETPRQRNNTKFRAENSGSSLVLGEFVRIV